jgi:hypothetical protein
MCMDEIIRRIWLDEISPNQNQNQYLHRRDLLRLLLILILCNSFLDDLLTEFLYLTRLV